MENKISYILSADEVKETLFTAGVLKPYKKKVIGIIVISVILLILTVNPTEPLTYTSAVALVFMNLFAYFAFKKHEENTIKGSTTGEVTVLTAFEDYINVVVEAYEANWNIEKADVFAVLESDNLIIIQLVDGRLMSFPKKSINETNKQSFEKVLNYFSGLENNQNKELGE